LAPLLFAVPLYLFYNSNQDIFYNINSANISVDVLTDNNHVLNLFTVNKLKINKPLTEYDPKKADSLIRDFYELKRFPKKQFYVRYFDSVH
jgi:hypothetical protein